MLRLLLRLMEGTRPPIRCQVKGGARQDCLHQCSSLRQGFSVVIWPNDRRMLRALLEGAPGHTPNPHHTNGGRVQLAYDNLIAYLARAIGGDGASAHLRQRRDIFADREQRTGYWKEVLFPDFK
jgi:hypothetical protein